MCIQSQQQLCTAGQCFHTHTLERGWRDREAYLSPPSGVVEEVIFEADDGSVLSLCATPAVCNRPHLAPIILLPLHNKTGWNSALLSGERWQLCKDSQQWCQDSPSGSQHPPGWSGIHFTSEWLDVFWGQRLTLLILAHPKALFTSALSSALQRASHPAAKRIPFEVNELGFVIASSC